MAFSQESFGVECGCPGEASGTPELASTPAPASGGDSATVTSPSSAGGLSCDASSITITSPQLDDFEGCYTDTAVDGTTSHYAQTGVGLEGGVKAVFAASVDERGHDVSRREDIRLEVRRGGTMEVMERNTMGVRGGTRWWWWWWVSWVLQVIISRCLQGRI